MILLGCLAGASRWEFMLVAAGIMGAAAFVGMGYYFLAMRPAASRDGVDIESLEEVLVDRSYFIWWIKYLRRR
jgi:hypothetical protein